MIYFPRKTWIKISQKEIDAQMSNEWINLDNKTEEEILSYILARIEHAERFADYKAMTTLLNIYGLELV